VTAVQVREVISRRIAAGRWQRGDPTALVVLMPSMTRCGRLASSLACPPGCWGGCALTGCCGRGLGERDHVPARGPTGEPLPVPANSPAPTADRHGTAGSSPWRTQRGRSGRDYHGADHPLWTAPPSRRCGDRLYLRLTHGSAWTSHDGPLPVIERTLIRRKWTNLPGDRHVKPVWQWCPLTGPRPLTWAACGRRSSAVSILNTHSGCSSRTSG